ncbi:MAG: exosortase/archaeosortase family protein [Limisphaerales bacterium]
MTIARPGTALLTGVENATRRWWTMALPLALFSVLWLNLVRELCFQWSTREQYAFGWFVPLLALGLFWRRWTNRPKCQPVIPPRWVGLVVFAAAGLLLPLQVLCEANPDWPLCSWLIALFVVSLSLYAFLLTGGWRWVLHFAFPVGFILIAVRWPYRIEHGVTNGLMRMVAGLTVNVLGWFDVISSQRGNLIELSTGAVGIDEACSGIRSFQSTMMGALFLGELYLLSWRRRLAVLAGGVLLAVCFNVVRTLILTWQASAIGIDALKKWHDPAGFSIFGATFACLWLLAWRLRSKVQSPKAGAQSPGAVRSAECEVRSAKTAVQSPAVSGPSPVVRSPSFRVPFTYQASRTTFPISAFCFPLSAFRSRLGSVVSSRWSPGFRYLLALGCWSVCFVALTELWYVAHERAEKPPQRWNASLPVTNSTFKTVELTPPVLALLRNDESITGTWRQQNGMEWTVFFLRWNAKSVPSVIRARGHRPDVCLPAAGFREISSLPIEYFEAGPLKLPFQRYIYEANRQLLYVFFCLWQDGDEAQRGMHLHKGLRLPSFADRLLLAGQGKRRLGQQTLELVVSGCENFQQAEQQVRSGLPELIRLGQPGQRMARNTK